MKKIMLALLAVLLMASCLGAVYLYSMNSYIVDIEVEKKDGRPLLSWEHVPSPGIYTVETYYKTTGLVEGTPEFVMLSSDTIFDNHYIAPTSAIPTYYKLSGYSISGKISSGKIMIPDSHEMNPLRPVPVTEYPKDKPASLKPYLIWHSIPDGVLYELELLSAPPEVENNLELSQINHLYASQQVFTNGLQIDLTPYYKPGKPIYWRVRAMNLRKEPVGVFSTAMPVYLDENQPLPDKPVLNLCDRMPNFQQPVYPTFTWFPMLGAVRYEVELLTTPPKQENNTLPTSDRVWAKVVDSSFSCYDEYARYHAGTYYWRVRGLDENGHTIGKYSDTDSFSVEHLINRPKLAVLGDSITHGGGAVSFSPSCLEYSYLTYMDMPAINLGLSGDTSYTTLARFERDVLPVRPQNLLIMTGSNSLRDESITADMIIDDLAHLSAKCHHHDIRPVFITLPPLNPDNIMLAFQTPTDPNWLQKMQRVNDFIKEQPYHIDIEPYFYDDTHTLLAAEWANDGLHMDVRGKMLIGEIISMHKHLFR